MYNVGDVVLDDLTQKKAIVLELVPGTGLNNSYVIDNPYLDGFRYPWELSDIEE